MKSALLPLACAALVAVPAFAQLEPPNAAGVTMGHVHLAVKDVAAHRAFWTNIMGGKLVKNGPLEMVEFPGIYILFRQSDQAQSPVGSVLDHFGFVVKDFPAAEAKWKANKLKIEPTENPNESYVFGPDDVKIEVFGDPKLPVPIQMFHFHYYTPRADIPAIQAWYVKVLGGVAGTRPCIACLSKPIQVDTTNVPGGNLSFSPSMQRMAPTRGRSIDHAGYEVKNLEAYVKKLEAQGIKLDEPVRQVPNTNIKVAFLTDPWGGRVELTENLPPARH